MDFQLSKQNALSKKDKSHEQKWDEKIKPLCDKINSHKDLYTTSSCSGRITIVPKTSKKLQDAFLFKSHNKIITEEILPIIQNLESLSYFRLEPAALHIACQSLQKSQQILSKARNLGWKKSGIISTKGRFVLELFAPETIITPIIKGTKEKYLELLIQEANERLKQTWNKINLLEKIF